MTAAPHESSVTEGVLSLEIRWILRGELDGAVGGWFERSRPGVESREDTYLVHPNVSGLSVKVRAGEELDVKVYQGSPGILEVPRCARGRLQSWQKWSFPLRSLSRGSSDPALWRPVAKRRRISRFSRATGWIAPGAWVPGGAPGCAVELTEVRTRGQAWWSLGFEATGPADLLRSELEACAALVFTQALPGGVELGMDDSKSYAEWLGGHLSAGRDAGA
jgi:hypothetical protein